MSENYKDSQNMSHFYLNFINYWNKIKHAHSTRTLHVFWSENKTVWK